MSPLFAVKSRAAQLGLVNLLATYVRNRIREHLALAILSTTAATDCIEREGDRVRRCSTRTMAGIAEEEEAEEGEQGQGKCEWQWSNSQTRGVLLHQDRTRVTFHPNGSWGCAAIRGLKPLLPNMEHFFEVVIDGPFYGQARMVGIGTRHVILQSHNYDFYPLLGKDDNSWALNYNGEKYHAGQKEKYIAISLEKLRKLRIGVYYDGLHGTLCFEINGESHGVAYSNIYPDLELYPMLCASSAGTTMTLTQSHSTIISLKAVCRGVIRMALSDSDIRHLPLPNHLKNYLSYRSNRGSRESKKS